MSVTTITNNFNTEKNCNMVNESLVTSTFFLFDNIHRKNRNYLNDNFVIFYIANYIDVDCKDMTTRYANDVIASCAFGLKVDSMAEEENEFYLMGKKASNFNFKQLLMFFAMINFPNLTKV
jgi:hypothetical protein